MTVLHIRSTRPASELISGLWRSRGLIAFFTWRDLKVRYRQTLVGVGWAVLQPIVLMSIFTVFLSGIIDVGNSNVSYALFVFTGLVPWTFFAQSVNQAANSIVNHQDLIKRASFNRLVLPVSAVGPFLVDFAVSSLVAVIWTGLAVGGLSWNLLAVPFVGLWGVVVALAVGIGLSALNVRFRDVRYATPFLLQAWLFATPIVYPPELAPAFLRELLYLNPMAGVVALYRWAVLGGAAPALTAVGLSLASAIVLLVASTLYFSRSEPGFADAI